MHPTAVNAPALLRRVLGATLGIVLLGGSLVLGQPPATGGGKSAKPKPAEATPAQSLEDLLAAALKNNPDIRVAEAKLREAEAELNRTRLQVTQKVVTLSRGLEAQKALVQSAEEEHRRAFPSPEPARQKVLQAKAKLSEIEAEIAYLTGQQPKGVAADPRDSVAERLFYAQALARTQIDWLAEEGKRGSGPQGTMAENIRGALDRLVGIAPGQPLPDVIDQLQRTAGNVPILFTLPEGLKQGVVDVSFRGNLPLGAALQLIADNYGLRVYVRPYGLLMTGSTQTPPGAVALHEFWKGEAEREKLKAPAPADKK